jgi:cation diffusion facilitator family transporter
MNQLKTVSQSQAADQKENTALQEAVQREKTIIRTSVIGILANVVLAGFKAVIGIMSGSIAIFLDAVNNITDAGSSLVTIIGTKLAAMQPNRKHPFGYGRIEYLSAMIIAAIVLDAGISSFVESVKKILNPETPDYSTPSLLILGAAVVIKILMGRYVKKVGERVHSDSLVNSGKDAVMDSVISASTLVAAVIYLTTKISLEAWLGAVISIVIIKSGFEMLWDTISQLLGERVDAEEARVSPGDTDKLALVKVDDILGSPGLFRPLGSRGVVTLAERVDVGAVLGLCVAVGGVCVIARPYEAAAGVVLEKPDGSVDKLVADIGMLHQLCAASVVPGCD